MQEKPEQAKPAKLSEDVEDAFKLIFTATRSVTDTVEYIHSAVHRFPQFRRRPSPKRSRGISKFVYRNIHYTIHLVEKSTTSLVKGLSPALQINTSGAHRDRCLATLNGVFGDYLSEANNSLALPMTLKIPSTEPPREHLLVAVHGICMSHQQWTRKGVNHVDSLAEDMQLTPIYVNYNSGQSIPENGRLLTQQLEQLLQSWPVPIRSLTMIGYSMGGLVTRSAIVSARKKQSSWLPYLRKIISLGCPHLGTPLERGGEGLQSLLEMSSYAAPLANLANRRSAGIKDLGEGRIDKDPASENPADQGLPVRVPCLFVAGSTGSERDYQKFKLSGDRVVPVRSALGLSEENPDKLDNGDIHRVVVSDTGHLELLSEPRVYQEILDWFRSS